MDLSRREALKLAAWGAAGAVLGLRSAVFGQAAGTAGEKTEKMESNEAKIKGEVAMSEYVLPPLPYSADALEPVIDAQTVGLHHDKHHAAYVKNANAALDQLAAARKAGDFKAVKALSLALAFNASGAVLHDLYWQSMDPKSPREPKGKFAKQIDADFGSLEALKAQFAAAAKDVEGSGWATLAWEPSIEKLVVLQIEKHQNLTVWGATPLVVCDVWEHAYYLNYQNRRPDYVDAWMGIIDWASAGHRFEHAVEAPAAHRH